MSFLTWVKSTAPSLIGWPQHWDCLFQNYLVVWALPLCHVFSLLLKLANNPLLSNLTRHLGNEASIICVELKTAYIGVQAALDLFYKLSKGIEVLIIKMKANTLKNKEASGKMKKLNTTQPNDTGKTTRCAASQSLGQLASMLPAASGGSHRGSCRWNHRIKTCNMMLDPDKQVVLHWGIKETEITTSSLRAWFWTGIERASSLGRRAALLSWAGRSCFGRGRDADSRRGCPLFSFTDIWGVHWNITCELLWHALGWLTDVCWALVPFLPLKILLGKA